MSALQKTQSLTKNQQQHQLQQEKGSWDCSKENIQPLKFGRSSQAVVVGGGLTNFQQQQRQTTTSSTGGDEYRISKDTTSSVASNNETDSALNNQRRYFEEKIRVQDSDDPLDYWFRYIKWLENVYPSGKFKEIKALAYKCILTLEDHTQYVNDFRWWYVWHKFACYSSNLGSLPIYEFMQSKGQCTGLAVFYKQWAFELEQAEDYVKAKKVYEMGLSAGGQPVRDLENALREFEIRVGRKIGTQQADPNNEDTRKLLGVLKGVGKNATAPVVRISSQQDAKLPNSLNSAPKGSKISIFDENRPPSLQLQREPLSFPQEFAQLESLANDCAKENIRNPGIWPVQKLKAQTDTMKGKIQSNFTIYADQTTSGSATDKVSSVNSEIVKPVNNEPSNENLFPKPKAIYKGKPVVNSKGELKEVPAYDSNIISGGLEESSFEEYRAMRWQAEHQPPESCVDTNCVPMEETSITFQEVSPLEDEQPNVDNGLYKKNLLSSVHRNDQQEQQNMAIRKQAAHIGSLSDVQRQKQQPIFGPEHLTGSGAAGFISNSSFTSKFYRDAIAAFSNTLQLNDDGRNDENASSCHQNTISEFEHQPKDGGFKIFDENAENMLPKVLMEPQTYVSIENKENVAPVEKRKVSSPAKRKAKGILTDAVDIACEPIDDIVNVVTKKATSDSINTATEKGSTQQKWNESDFTVAGQFTRPLIGERAVSTPCHSVSRSLLPSFSVTKAAVDVENENETCLVESSQNRIDISASKLLTSRDIHKTITINSDVVGAVGTNNCDTVKFYENKLSTISEENSRECRSSSSGSNSGVSSSALSGGEYFFSTRKAGAANSGFTNNLHISNFHASYVSLSQRHPFTPSTSSS